MHDLVKILCSNTGSFLQNCYLFLLCFFLLEIVDFHILSRMIVYHLRKTLNITPVSALFLFKKKFPWNHKYIYYRPWGSRVIEFFYPSFAFAIILYALPCQPICQLYLKVAIFATASMANSAENAPWRKTMKVRWIRNK